MVCYDALVALRSSICAGAMPERIYVGKQSNHAPAAGRHQFVAGAATAEQASKCCCGSKGDPFIFGRGAKRSNPRPSVASV